MSSKVAVVILAGGEGARIGGDKPRRTLHGERLIDRAVRQARSWSEIIAVSVREPQQVRPIDAQLITDEPDVAGPLGGLVSAVKFGQALGCDFVLTIPADTPLLPADLLDRLVRSIGSRDCALASSEGRLHPACGLWRTNRLHEVDAYIRSGRRSLNGLAETIGFEKAEWQADSIDPFFNINTPDDLSRAERLV